MSGFPKQKRPHNMRVLQSWIREYADQQQMAESRVRRAVSFMLVALPLEHSLDSEGRPLTVYRSWAETYARLAAEEGFPVGDVEEAAALVGELIAEINAS